MSKYENYQPLKLGGGRELPKLLFVTHRERLTQVLDSESVELVFSLIKQANMPSICELPSSAISPSECRTHVRQCLYALNNQDPPIEIAGVVILGGHSVVPICVRDTLDENTRLALASAALAQNSFPDDENFLVWSDDGYGVIEASHGESKSTTVEFPDFPVSRVPDGGSPELMLNALTKNIEVCSRNIGLFSAEWNYPNSIFSELTNPKSSWLLFDKTTPANLNVNASNAYFVLHGTYLAGTEFFGTQNSSFSIDQAINSCSKVFFSAACWGAILVNKTAYQYVSDNKSASFITRTSSDAIALQFIDRGAIGVIGCTAKNIVPSNTVSKFYFSAWMELFFWIGLDIRNSPALSLHIAKKLFILYLQSTLNKKTVKTVALEMKVYQNFTCLGLGW
jgi:hypothetical protein